MVRFAGELVRDAGITMIKLFSVKQKQKEDNAKGRPVKKQSAGELRVQKGPSLSLSLPFFSLLLHPSSSCLCPVLNLDCHMIWWT